MAAENISSGEAHIAVPSHPEPSHLLSEGFMYFDIGAAAVVMTVLVYDNIRRHFRRSMPIQVPDEDPLKTINNSAPAPPLKGSESTGYFAPAQLRSRRYSR